MPGPLPRTTEILIVGAGPSGRAAAISLIHNGVEPSKLTIVDCAAENINGSRAMAIHAATLEALDTYGCASKLIELGIKGATWQYSNRTASIFASDFEDLSPYTKFPFMLLVPQSILENVLEKRLEELGVQVFRPFRVIGMKACTGSRGIDVLFESREVIQANFVIGADGVKSTIRQSSGVIFLDPDGQAIDALDNHALGKALIADISLSRPLWDLDTSKVDVTLIGSQNGLFLILPFVVARATSESPEMRYRAFFSIPPSLGEPPSNPSLEYIQKLIDLQAPLGLSSDEDLNPDPVCVTEIHWSSRFRMHSAVADTFFKQVYGGHVFLLGDAAHIHPPFGGQGMNLGLRDAFGLGPVLANIVQHAKHFNPDDSDSLAQLEHYASQRRIRGLYTIRLTKGIMTVINWVIQPHFLNWRMRLLRFLHHIPMFKRQVPYWLSGLGNQ